MRRVAIAAALLLAAAAVAGVARPEGAGAVEGAPAPDSVTVSGTGSVAAVPTRAQLFLGVDSRGESAKATLAANAREMRKVIAAVRAAGGGDVRTQSVSLSPVPGENGEVNGYAASNAVTTTIDVQRAGAVIDAAVDAGANQVSGPSLSLADQSKLYRQALTAAVADARERAATLAAAAGRALGKVTSISEGGGALPTESFQKASAADSATPIEAGTQEASASVSVTFALA